MALIGQGCKIVSERKNLGRTKGESISFIFRPPLGGTLDSVNAALLAAPPELSCNITWQVE